MKKEPANKYTPGMFHLFKIVDNLEYWTGFPEMMWGLGYEMDACNSFEEYRKNSKLKLKEPHSKRENYKNILYLLEHTPRQIVGNYLFSEWRYFTHWSWGWDHYDVDFLRRIIEILESKSVEKEV